MGVMKELLNGEDKETHSRWGSSNVSYVQYLS